MTVDKSSIAVSDSSMKIVDPEQKDYHPGKEKGLGWFITGLFVIGDIAGGGIIALPAALIQMGKAPPPVVCV
ncbi:unnamed protein product [Anisakis simplex]|uniref:Aa_trans domain-containing protein n=1 Tax=Anisakis simplex TaxID=6269 RepID=A0A0M3J8I1_ANISI|nr:unnamed protein product [Anisakis simplex]